MRQQSAIVAVIQDGDGRFLVTFSAKWGGYAVPMIAVPDADTGSRSVSRLSTRPPTYSRLKAARRAS